MSDSEYRRGQIFGFTIAETLLLILFSLLLVLSIGLYEKDEKIESYESDREKISKILMKYDQNPDEIFIILKDFRASIKAQELELNKDMVRYEEVRKLFVSLGPEYFSSSNENEKIKIIKDRILLGDTFISAGFSSETSTSELHTLKTLQTQIRESGDDVRLALENLNEKLNKINLEKIQIGRENNNLKAELAKLTGNKGFGIPPCWINDSGKGISIFTVRIDDHSIKVISPNNFEKYSDQKYFNEVKNYIQFANKEMTPTEFKNAFSPLRQIGYKDKENSCVFWVDVQDCVSNDKSVYKLRSGDVRKSFNSRSEISCSADINS